MVKDLQWFKFSPLNWMTGRIRKESAKVQVAFVEICCQYWKNRCCMTYEQADLEIGAPIATLVNRKFIGVEGDHIYIKFLDDQMKEIQGASVQKSNAAKSRWNARAKQNDADALHVHKAALQVHDSAMQNDADKRRQEKTRQERVTHDIFADGIFLERIGPSHRGKDLQKAFADCYAYHAADSENWELGDWKKKFITWMTNVKPTANAKMDYKIG